MNGDDFAAAHLGDDEATFERAVVQAVTEGDFVDWAFCDVPVGDRFVVSVAADYFALGIASNPFRVPLSAPSAQKVADILGGMLPWRRLVDAIWKAAGVRLAPRPGGPLGIKIGTDDQMSVRAFLLHNDEVQRQLETNWLRRETAARERQQEGRRAHEAACWREACRRSRSTAGSTAAAATIRMPLSLVRSTSASCSTACAS